MNNIDLEQLLDLTERTRGWSNRRCPPQRVMLCGNCQLIVIPAYLWRQRCGMPRAKPTCPPIPLCDYRMRKAG